MPGMGLHTAEPRRDKRDSFLPRWRFQEKTSVPGMQTPTVEISIRMTCIVVVVVKVYFIDNEILKSILKSKMCCSVCFDEVV